MSITEQEIKAAFEADPAKRAGLYMLLNWIMHSNEFIIGCDIRILRSAVVDAVAMQRAQEKRA